MDFLNRLLGRTTDTKYKYRGAKLPEKPLTPREIEEMHRKLHPDTHVDNAAEPKPIFDSRDWNVPYTQSLEEKFSAVGSLQDAQSGSLLFSKLPLEVRTQIWRLVVGNHKVHLTVHHGRLKQSSFESENYQWLPQRGLLRVPLVCRAAYMESISYLYSDNTFCFGFGQASSKSALTSLDTMLPKQHITSMQHIEVGWHLYAGVSQYYDSHPQAWDITLDVPAPETETLWNNVSAELVKLSHMRTLRIVVWLSGDERGQFVERERDMLAPLLVMGFLERFDVHLPWKQDGAKLWNDAPFTVSRHFRVKVMYGVSIPLPDDDFYWSGSVAQHRIYR
ncbi:hypothetical protein FVEG_13043 [Fusarium verticillioides 7600]|uniref:DUF7730 domain-containing protein n=1 Tax=Gibberella moniliformis (strain M3125 / FGSC 7600) TaxID=334819 RepID=W7NFB4_GIBM7|nr:hypothetical protein FVEG_13043 [Fusarium verticillioides 7600]EWG54962.1 hypothetical protein FVEG_13043 [Fusarium verticillioides 7600]